MLTEERQQAIAAYIEQNDICRVAELCKLTNSSESTIRRDLVDMEKRGLIARVHGGARSIANYSHDVEQQVRFNINVEQKRKIAKFAAKKVEPNTHIFLDAGTTIYEMVPYLKNIPGITVVTNGVDTALACLDAHIPTFLLGGRVKDETHAVVGEIATKQLDELNFTTAFVGANGLQSDGNFTTPDTVEAAIKKAELNRANKAFVLMDASKIGVNNFAIFGNTLEATLITNKLSDSQKKKLPAQIRLEEVN